MALNWPWQLETVVMVVSVVSLGGFGQGDVSTTGSKSPVVGQSKKGKGLQLQPVRRGVVGCTKFQR